MISHARKMGANAVVGVRYDTGPMVGAAEVLCYGTAVVVEALNPSAHAGLDLRRVAAIAATVVCGLAVDPRLRRRTHRCCRSPRSTSGTTATLETDPHDGKVVISTQNGLRGTFRSLHMVWHDEFLTALIDQEDR